jgi:hypothetical protein
LNDFFYLAHWHDPEEDGFPYLDEELGQRGEDDEVDDDDASTTSSASVVRRHSSLGTRPTLAATENKWLSNKNSSSSSSNNNNTNNNIPSPPLHHHHHHPISPLTHNPPLSEPPQPPPLITETDLSHLSLLTTQSHLSLPTTRYLYNLIAFLRTHRAVISASITPTATAHLTRLCKSLASLHGLDYVTPSLVALAARKVYLHRIEVVQGAEGERSMQWGSEGAVVEGLLRGVGGAEGVVEEVLGGVAVPS